MAAACGAGSSGGGDTSGTMSLKTSSTTAMLASLDQAVKAKEPIVVSLWHPHWAYSRYDLKDLKDPKNGMGGAEKLHFAARKGFKEDFPSVAKSMSKFTIDDKSLQSLEDAIQKAGDGNAAKGVKNWTEKHQDFMKSHFGDIKDGSGKITIPYITWAEDIALSNMYKQVLESKGYSVKLKQLQAGVIFQSLSEGTSDVFLDYWLPTTHKQYKKKYGDKIVDLGIWYKGASLELTVPKYMEKVNTIADLKKYAEKFDGQIIGIEPGAGITNQIKNNAIPTYNLGKS